MQPLKPYANVLLSYTQPRVSFLCWLVGQRSSKMMRMVLMFRLMTVTVMVVLDGYNQEDEYFKDILDCASSLRLAWAA